MFVTLFGLQIGLWWFSLLAGLLAVLDWLDLILIWIVVFCDMFAVLVVFKLLIRCVRCFGFGCLLTVEFVFCYDLRLFCFCLGFAGFVCKLCGFTLAVYLISCLFYRLYLRIVVLFT